MRRHIPALRIERLNNSLAVSHETDFVSNGEGGLETVILDTKPAALRRYFIASAQYLAKALPAFGFNRLAASIADQPGPVE